MTSELVILFCPTCAADSLAEAPPCPDGHGEACPDRACVECGTALLFDCETVATIQLVTARHSARHAA